eukprot:TRINITY_DN11071_c0_g1_i5.p3 TRINITY_DN11071_c0_g1~~TRINITY_DN11071_c0_g1_i5.p3  ORF type:complete len:106 (-),score=19.62 TRINITY_DN11071_c0_g1_i5:124-441(-)
MLHVLDLPPLDDPSANRLYRDRRPGDPIAVALCILLPLRVEREAGVSAIPQRQKQRHSVYRITIALFRVHPVLCVDTCLLYTSDAADEEDSVDLGGRRIIKKKKK